MQLDIESGNMSAMTRIRYAGNRKESGVVFGGVFQHASSRRGVAREEIRVLLCESVTESLYRTVGVTVELCLVGGDPR
jgi:hypothetical protein